MSDKPFFDTSVILHAFRQNDTRGAGGRCGMAMRSMALQFAIPLRPKLAEEEGFEPPNEFPR